MSETKSENKPKKKFNRNRRRKNFKNNSGENKTNSNNNKKRYQGNRNRRPKSLTPARILQKYDNLLEQYMVARKKFFEMFARAQGKQLDKIKNNYANSLKSLRDFESKLEDWQKEVLDKKVNQYKEDREFSSNHDLKPEGDIVSFTGEFEDPHLLSTQKASDWASDTEESSGTMEDYQKYKDSQV